MQIGLNLYSAYKFSQNKSINKDSKPANTNTSSYSYPSVQNLKANLVPFMGKAYPITDSIKFEEEFNTYNEVGIGENEYDETPEERSFNTATYETQNCENEYKNEKYYAQKYDVEFVKELKKLAANPKLKAEDQKAFLTLYRTYKDSNDPELQKIAYDSRDFLASHLMKIVFSCTKKYYPYAKNHVTDLISEGILGLYEGFDKANPNIEANRYDFYIAGRMINYLAMNKKPLNIPYRIIRQLRDTANQEKCEAMIKDPSLAKNNRQLADAQKTLQLQSHYLNLLNSNVAEIDDPEKKFEVPAKTEIIQILVDKDERKEIKADLLPLLKSSKRSSDAEKNLEFILNYNGLQLSSDGRIIELEIEGNKDTYLSEKFGYKQSSLRETYSKLCKGMSKTPLYKEMAKKYFNKEVSIPTSDALNLAKKIKKGNVDEKTKESFRTMILTNNDLATDEKRFIIAHYVDSNIKDETVKMNVSESWALRVAQKGLEKIELPESYMH